MGERNPLFLICPWEGTVSALNHETASWCTCVFLGGLPCKHGLAQNCEIWDQSPGQKGSGGRSCTEPAPMHWSFLWETSSVLQRWWPWGKSQLRKELRWCWAGCSRADLGEKDAHLCSWPLACKSNSLQTGLGWQWYQKVQHSHFPHFPLYHVKQYLWNSERGVFCSILGFFDGVCVNKD